jgi:hypothetical protein
LPQRRTDAVAGGTPDVNARVTRAILAASRGITPISHI